MEQIKIRLVKITNFLGDLKIAERYIIEGYVPRGFFGKSEWIKYHDLGDIGEYEAKVVFDTITEDGMLEPHEKKEVLRIGTLCN